MKLFSFWLKSDVYTRHIFTHLQSLFHLSMQLMGMQKNALVRILWHYQLF
jgi:hypothetical protein